MTGGVLMDLLVDRMGKGSRDDGTIRAALPQIATGFWSTRVRYVA